ncbi:aldo/keto reductase [Georgenia sunbinii]|uniref:aldo/keto reductase n=1 Tax=Georgenia sunbinii TaxID=3117728 RepID=UPI002F26541C
MKQRVLGRTGREVSVVGLGTWQLGADWGDVDPADALGVIDAAVQSGVTFLDTADVYGDGASEQLIGQYLAAHPGHGLTVATKMGRRAEQRHESYTPENFRAWVDRSRRNLGVDTLDLVQLHCPPSSVIAADATYDALDDLVADGAIAAYGVSVETCAQALDAIARPNLASVQIILNAFRLRPLDEVLPAAAAAGVGIIARVPLASGLLSGRYTEQTTFAANDHRTFNRDGSHFDVGETFAGVDFATGVAAARQLAAAVPDGVTPAQAAIAWVAAQPGVSSVIPGARTRQQARANSAAAGHLDVAAALDPHVRQTYDEHIRAAVHGRW